MSMWAAEGANTANNKAQSVCTGSCSVCSSKELFLGALLGTPERGVPEVFWRKNTCVTGGEQGEGNSKKGHHVQRPGDVKAHRS